MQNTQLHLYWCFLVIIEHVSHTSWDLYVSVYVSLLQENSTAFTIYGYFSEGRILPGNTCMVGVITSVVVSLLKWGAHEWRVFQCVPLHVRLSSWPLDQGEYQGSVFLCLVELSCSERHGNDCVLWSVCAYSHLVPCWVSTL